MAMLRIETYQMRTDSLMGCVEQIRQSRMSNCEAFSKAWGIAGHMSSTSRKTPEQGVRKGVTQYPGAVFQ